MNINDRRGLKVSARESLAGASYDPKKLILIHTGAMVALSLVLALVDYFLEREIGGTGGLSGVGIRSILETLRTVLMVGQTVALLFWQIGYVYAGLRISRGEPAEPASLLEGFRRFGPVLRLRLVLALLYTGVTMICVYAASIIFSLTPLAESLVAAYEAGTEEAIFGAMNEIMLPLLGIVLVLMLIIMVPYYYRLRLTEYALMDDPRLGAMAAIRKSRAMMRGNRIKLLKLDLSFWWFYLCEMLVTVVAYGDYILPLFGYSLPWSDTVSYYVFLVLSYLCQLALYWWRGNEIRVTYAKFYEALLPEEA